MKIIKIRHEDFKLFVEVQPRSGSNDTFYKTFITAERNHSKENFVTRYELTSPAKEFDLWHPDNQAPLARDMQMDAYPVFFQNRDYKFIVLFTDKITQPVIYSKTREVKNASEMLLTEDGKYIMDGTLNFENEVGTFDFTLSYIKKAMPKTVAFKFEVFPVKLDFKADFPIIVKGIEKGYPRLVLDYLRKTHSPFTCAPGHTEDQLLWWVIFGNIYDKLLHYLKAIMENPHTSMTTVFVAEKKRGSLRDNRLQHESTIRYFGEPRNFVTIRKWELMDDNHENRFVKFILEDISRCFNNIYKAIIKEVGSRMTIEYKDQLGFVNNTLKEMKAHPLFKRIGEMTHPDPMSHIMQFHPVYAGLRMEWHRLKQAYNHFEGSFKMELRNIGYLYKIWCFFKIEGILRMRLGPPYRVEKVPELGSASMRERQLKDINAGVAFRMENGNIVELFHELYYEIKGEEGLSSVKPDIVLRIRRSDRPLNVACSCIFIVRYEYKESVHQTRPDLPGDADIHEVGFMRENIFHSEKPGKGTNMTKANWIGGYVLYPGKGSKDQLQQELDKARKKGNKGGLALRPDDKRGSGDIVLRGQIDYLLENADKVINEILVVQGELPQSEDAFVFIAFITATDTVMINYLLNGEAEQFVYKDFIQHIGDGAVRYFAPYIEGQGISCFYEISGHYWKSRKEAFAPDHPLFENNTRKCMVLKLERKEILNGCYKVKGRINNKRFTTLKHLLNPKDEHIITIPEQRIAPK